MAVTSKALLDKLNTTCNKAILQAVALSFSRTHFDVELEHWLLKLLDSPNNDLAFVLRQYAIDAAKVKKELERSLSNFKTGNGRRRRTRRGDSGRHPRGVGLRLARTGGAQGPLRRTCSPALLTTAPCATGCGQFAPNSAASPAEKFQADMNDLLPRVASEENEQEAAAAARRRAAASGRRRRPARRRRRGGKTPALDQFTVNLTANAKAGKIDPVVGRDHEIRQVIDILTRRRQNNPILTGEAGVGKTAVVEGLALRIVGRRRARAAQERRQLRTLDLGLLAGRGRGEGRVREPAEVGHRRGEARRRRRSSCSSTRPTRSSAPAAQAGPERRGQPAQAGAGPRRTAHRSRPRRSPSTRSTSRPTPP